jgi:hypothetical protein
MSPRGSLEDLHAFLRDDLGPKLAEDETVEKVRLHLCSPFVNDGEHPPSPDVAHAATSARAELAIIEIAFENPLARRRFFASDAYQNTLKVQAVHIAQLKAFAVSGVYTYVFEGVITTAGLRGSRAAELIEYLGATNQLTAEVEALFLRDAPNG